MNWVISDHVVHASWLCDAFDGDWTPYVCAPTTPAEMLMHLMRPDRKDGKTADTLITACKACVGGTVCLPTAS